MKIKEIKYRGKTFKAVSQVNIPSVATPTVLDVVKEFKRVKLDGKEYSLIRVEGIWRLLANDGTQYILEEMKK